MPKRHQQQYWGPRSKGYDRCSDCGRTRQQVSQIDVHHREPDRGDNPGTLIGLCRRCHLRARHRRDAEFIEGAFEPETPKNLGPNTPSTESLSPGP